MYMHRDIVFVYFRLILLLSSLLDSVVFVIVYDITCVYNICNSIFVMVCDCHALLKATCLLACLLKTKYHTCNNL